MTDQTKLGFIGDEHWGKGGRYVVDSDGKRVPAPTEEAAPAVPAVPTMNQNEGTQHE